MVSRPGVPDMPSNSAALSLLELRRHLLRRAGVLSARAKSLRDKGDVAGAARLSEESDRLRHVARTMNDGGQRTGDD